MTILTDSVTLASGATVAMDRPEGGSYATVLLVPPFAMNARNMLAAARVLTANSITAALLQPRDYPDGRIDAMRRFRLTKLEEDIADALKMLRPDGVLAVSLAARPVLRVLGRVDGSARPCTALITPVVDVRSTLLQVIGEDVFTLMEQDQETKCIEVLGHDVEIDFARDARVSGYEALPGAVIDAAAVSSRIHLVAGDSDPWVRTADLREVVGAGGGRISLQEISAATHQLYRNPVLAMRFFAAAATFLLSELAPAHAHVIRPPFADVVARIEQAAAHSELERDRETGPVLAVHDGGRVA